MKYYERFIEDHNGDIYYQSPNGIKYELLEGMSINEEKPRSSSDILFIMVCEDGFDGDELTMMTGCINGSGRLVKWLYGASSLDEDWMRDEVVRIVDEWENGIARGWVNWVRRVRGLC